MAPTSKSRRAVPSAPDDSRCGPQRTCGAADGPARPQRGRLCAALDVDPLTLLSGQLDHSAELPILLALLDEAAAQAGPKALRSWVRRNGPHGRPIDALTRRDFAAFEEALNDLQQNGFVLRGGGT